MENYFHAPVMIREVIELLNVKNKGLYLDGTLGGGGYSRKISEIIGAGGLLVSNDLDPLSIKAFSKNQPDNVIIVNDNYSNIERTVLKNKDILNKLEKKNLLTNSEIKFDGIVLDLGLSSAQLDDRERGFSFSNDACLDMAFGPKSEGNTEWIVNNYNARELEEIIKDYGQDPWAKIIARDIVAFRKKEKIKSTKQLSEIIARAIPRKFWPKNINPATKTFQALRIETNKELDSLKTFLPIAINSLKKNGKIVIVSFHSLEDRIVKNYFRELHREPNPKIEVLTKRPLKPSDDEIEKNPRSRSAKLRAAKRI
jgi:16S rRNA (cytosine1402-N4)-methyltransferase